MIQTFELTTVIASKKYYQTIYSDNLHLIVEKWLQRIELLQHEVYSFNSKQVEHIKQQYKSGQLKVQLTTEPYFFAFEYEGKKEFVHIKKVNKSHPDFIARLSYLSIAEGGRSTTAFSGYRPHVKFNGKEALTSSEQLFIDKDQVAPGETAIAEMRIIGTDFFAGYLFAGQHFEVSEGPHLVGHGEIITVINPVLQHPDHV